MKYDSLLSRLKEASMTYDRSSPSDLSGLLFEAFFAIEELQRTVVIVEVKDES